jgi:hypothetical protein
VRILLRLRKESTNLSLAPPGQESGARTENIEEPLGSDIGVPEPQTMGTVEDLEMNEQSGYVIENTGSSLEDRQESGNVTENKGSYALKAGMLLKRKDVGGGR